LILDEFLSNLLLVIRTTELEFVDYAYCSILVYDVTVILIVQFMSCFIGPIEWYVWNHFRGQKLMRDELLLLNHNHLKFLF